MPIHKTPFEKGSLFVKFHVEFPQPGELSEKQLEQLEKILPSRRPAPVLSDDVEQVVLQPLTDYEKQKAQRPRGQQSQFQQREAYESDEEDGPRRGGGPGVQCAQQ